MMQDEYFSKFKSNAVIEKRRPNTTKMFKIINKDWVDPEEAKLKAERDRLRDVAELASLKHNPYKPKLKSM